MKSWIYISCVFLGGCSFGVLSTFVKLAYESGFNMSEVTGIQFVIGTILIWILALFFNKKKLSLNQIMKLLICGFPMGLTGIFYYYSLETLDASLAILFLFQFIWIGALVEWVILKHKPTTQKTVSIFIVLIGSSLAASLFSSGEKTIGLEGTVWGILAACSYSVFLVISSMVEKEVPALQRSAIFSTGGLLIVVLIVKPFSLMDTTSLFNIAPYGILLGLFGVVIPPILFSIGMPHLGPGTGSILTASELPVAILLSLFVLNETVDWIQWMGVLIILLGIVWGNVPINFRTNALKPKSIK
ncbi:EamA family transporter [Fictibacillus norfolkensis]|uniref:EamA family transporter n=1 Tax=Fictibacillus norfolkensis TaxID=2762233 RepID=A0ABR8SQZ4_9BACL|nr:DMT family transporter [Fictibacillus norfolkensis]MBD7965915.1 EamA family transporter [Fictibacillus norfolkensis]